MAVTLKAIGKLDGKQFHGEVKKMGNNVDRFGKNQLGALKGMIAGAFSVGVIVNFSRKLLKTADDLQTAANIFSLSMETMLAWQSVMAESGITAERFNKIFGRIASAQGDVRRGLATYVDAINDMNIAQEEFVGIGVDEALLLMAKRYEQAGDKGMFVEGVTKLLGTRVIGLVEVFQRLNRDGMEPYIANAKTAAEGMTELAAASDALEKAGNKVTLWAASVVPPLMKIGEVLGKLVDLASALGPTGIIGSIMGVGFKETSRQLFSGEIFKSIFRKKPEAGDTTAGPRKQPDIAKEIAKVKKDSGKDDEATERKILAIAKQREKIDEQREKVISQHSEREKDIMGGKGIATPEQARIDSMQSIGGIIGGGGKADQASRFAERAENIRKEINANLEKTNKKLDDLYMATQALGE